MKIGGMMRGMLTSTNKSSAIVVKGKEMEDRSIQTDPVQETTHEKLDISSLATKEDVAEVHRSLVALMRIQRSTLNLLTKEFQKNEEKDCVETLREKFIKESKEADKILLKMEKNKEKLT